MTTSRQKLIISILFVTTLAIVAYFVYQTDFAFLLRSQIPTTSILQKTGSLQCSPPLTLQPGQFQVSVKATDEHGATATKLVTVNVVASTPTPAPSHTPTPNPTQSPTQSPSPTPTPSPSFQCSDQVDNDGDNFIDSADSACHIDRNPLNPNSYVPTLNSEEDAPKTQCTDSLDNDGDGKVDGGDPECHTDGNPNNPNSYDPSIDSEFTPATVPRCSDGIDNDNDTAIDSADSTCHFDGNPNNPDSYTPLKDDEGGWGNAQCSDSLDNDGDGHIDGGDPNCHEDSDPNNPGSWNPYDDTEDDLDGGNDEDDEDNNDGNDDGEDPDPADDPTTFRYQTEVSHKVEGTHSGKVLDAGRTVVKLAHDRAFIDRKVSVPKKDYWMFINSKHDFPGPVDVGIYINGWPWKAVRLDKDDNKYRTHAIGKLRDFVGGTIRFRFLKDRFDLSDPTNEQKDRNLFIDWWALSESSTLPANPGRGSSTGENTSTGEQILPALNQIIREEIGPEHVTYDIWSFYARRLLARPTSSEAINGELRLRQVMRYWKQANPTRPRGI